MSRIFIVIIIVVGALAAAFVAANYWYDRVYENADAGGIPVTTIQVAENDVPPLSGEFTVPVFGGNQSRYMAILDILRSMLDESFEKDLSCVPEDGMWRVIPEEEDLKVAAEGAELGLLGEAPFEFTFDLPDELFWSVVLSHVDGAGTETPVFMEGEAGQETPAGLSDTVWIKKAGDFVFTVEGTLNKNSPDVPSGSVLYRARFSVTNPEPVFAAGRTELSQGDILSLRLENIPEGIVPELESELGHTVFTQDALSEEKADMVAEGLANWYAAVPISNSRAVGEYPVTISAGDKVYEISVTVKEYEFDFHNMIIDYSVPSVASAVTGAAIAEFREKVIPLFSVFSEERYWNGMFTWPIEMGPDDFISTEFGEIRITNGNQSTRRSHLGVDIAAKTGTPVLATGAGRVLLSQFLLNTGNTAIIDHGGGLISIYYHMDAVEDLEGTIVERGQIIGRVGSTGYSTGPHLHFEMRIGDQPINPSMLLDEGAGLYSAKLRG